MKKTASFLVLALLVGFVLSSCRARKVDCPAYGQTKPAAEIKHS